MRLLWKLITLTGCLLFVFCNNSENGKNQIQNEDSRKVLIEKKHKGDNYAKDNSKTKKADKLLKEKNSLPKRKHPIEYSNIFKQHIYSDNGIRYVVNLGWNLNNNADQKRKDFFYRYRDDRYGDEKTVIYDPWLQYGSMNGIYPCRPNCITDLYVVSPKKNYPIEDARLIIDSQDVCGEIRPFIWVDHKKNTPEALFITTMAVDLEGKKYYKGNGLLEENMPNWLNLSLFETPKHVKNKKVTLYRYPEKQDCYIAEVTAEGWNESTIDEDKFGPSKEIKWQGVYYVEKEKILILTPIEYHNQQFYGEDFSLAGLEDMNGDGVLDIIIGSPVSLILESYKNGFRSWGFAFFPRGGC